MAPPVTERGLKSVVWQSECGGAGAERGKARRPPHRALLSCPGPAVSWGAAAGTCCFGSRVPVGTFSCFPSHPYFLPAPGMGRVRVQVAFSLSWGTLSRRPGFGPKAPPWVSGPQPGFFSRGPCACPLRCSPRPSAPPRSPTSR